MQKKQAQKRQIVSELGAALSGANTMIITHYHGLTVKDIMALRRNINKVGGHFRVTKNSLARLAIKDTSFEELSPLFLGPTAVTFSDNPAAIAKVVVDYVKENEKLVIKGGIIDNKIIDTDEIKALAALPSLDELRAKIISTIIAPATKLVSVLQAPSSQLVRQLNAYSSK